MKGTRKKYDAKFKAKVAPSIWIINSDQGCQFTCKAWLDACALHPQMRVSMDGRGRAKDNIWIERFWKTIK